MKSGHDDRTEGIDDDGEARLSLRETPPVDAVVQLDAGEHAPADLWQTLASSDGFERALVEAVRELLAGVPYYARGRTLQDAGVTAGEGGYARLVVGFDRAPETDAYALAADVTRAFGSGEITPLGRLAFDEIDAGPLALLDAADVTPTVTVRIGEAFRERRREQRERALSLLARLGQVCTVAVAATGVTARWLVREHGEILPRSFSDQCTPRRQSDTPAADLIDEAREALDPDGRAVRILRDLAAEPGETLSYHELQAIHGDVSTGRVSQLVATLADHALVEKYGPRTEQQVDLLPAGRSFLETLDAEIGRQQRLESLFSETGQSPHSDVLPQPLRRGSQDPPATHPAEAEAGVPYKTRYLDRATHHGIAAAATDGDIVAAEGPTPPSDTAEQRHTRFVSYDEERDEALVAVRATTPLQYIVSVALGLASPRLFDEALPPDRLDTIDDPPAILRDARCIGGLSAEGADDAEALRDRLVEWGEDLAELTRDLHREEYEDRDRLCGEILRSAHGLAGSIVHLLDAAGVDLVRELRVPSLSDGQMEQLARTVAISTAIQSRYGAFTAYRQLFEDREEKRQTALTPDVDAADPLGSYVGGLVLRGPRAERFGYHVEGALVSPAEIHDDAPEFSVPVTVSTPSRPAYTAAVNRMLATKNIRATPQAVSLFEALASDVYAVTESIQWLGTEEQPRTIRLDEVRVSLSALEADRLLDDAPPSLSKAVAALLRSTRPLSRSDLADEANVSTRSLQRHLGALVALDVVRRTEEGYRLALPFNDERGEAVAPEPLTDDGVRAVDLVFDVMLTLVDDAGRLADPEDPVGQPFFGPGFNPGPLQVHFPRSNPYLSVALSLCNHSKTTDSARSTVAFGANLEQTPLGATPEVAHAG